MNRKEFKKSPVYLQYAKKQRFLIGTSAVIFIVGIILLSVKLYLIAVAVLYLFITISIVAAINALKRPVQRKKTTF